MEQRLGRLPAVALGPPGELVLRLAADAARGGVDDAVEADGVGRVVHDAQVGDDILNLAPAVEAGGADELVGHAALQERLFQGAGLGVGAVHDRHAAGRIALQLQGADGVHDEVGLFFLGVDLAHDDGHAALALGEQLFVHAVGVAADDGFGRVEDDLRGAVVLLQQDELRGGVVLAEAVDVAEVGAPPAVDRLVGIAHGKEVVLRRRQPGEQGVLGRVCVLELVHQDVLVLLLVALEHVGALVEEQHGVHQQVVEVHGVVGLQELLVVAVDAAGDLGDVVAGGVEVGGDQLVFRRADVVEHLGGREALVVQVEVGERLLDHLELVVAVEDDEVALVVGEVVGLAAQDAGAGGVEGAHGQPAQPLFADQRLQPAGHLARRLVGEGDGHDAPGGDVQLGHEVGDAVGEHARLAAARPGEHEHRPGRRGDGRLLLRVHLGEEVGEGGSGWVSQDRVESPGAGCRFSCVEPRVGRLVEGIIAQKRGGS